MQFTLEKNPGNINASLILELFLMAKMSLVNTKKIRNIMLPFCEFEPQITTFYVQSVFLFA